ncbi:MAG: dihydroorotase [Ignavibacteriae bacterium HGW-Ignavibacteriae-2]|jgi:allantoinase|nr:dihydroorotase [Bacteroidota bacterium]PKL89901.1 MAG: dihydroorotase [Ignavibacteriae bacterium HGW-Ignavibacteriae-2]
MIESFKKIENVFIPYHENNLALVDIIFHGHITEVIKKISRPVEWKDIATQSEKTKFINSLNLLPEKSNIPVQDGNYHLLIPGSIDPHVHFNTPGFEFREDFEHGSLAAAAGGVTTVIDMPCTSIPPVTNDENFRIKQNAVKNRSMIDYAFWGGIRKQDFSDLSLLEHIVVDLINKGVAGFKAYFLSGMDSFQDLNYEEMRKVAFILHKYNKILAIHAEDKNLVNSRTELYKSENKNSWKDYCNARDVSAELVAVDNCIKICKETGCKVHVVHLSSKDALNKIRYARFEEEVIITTETCPHYLHFTQNDFNNTAISNYLKTAPPVKNEEDKEALWQGLAEGSIDFVTTDHAGCNPETEKTGSNFWNIYGGIPGVQHRVPFMLSEGFLKGRLTLQRTCELLVCGPANFFNIPQKDGIKKGNFADFVLIDLWNSKKINAKEMHSKGQYTPFDGLELNCVIDSTYLRGVKIYDPSTDISPNYGFGNFIPIN